MYQDQPFRDIVLLLQASKLFTQEKKAEIYDKLPTLSDFDLIKIQSLLEQEQKMTAQYYNNLSSIEKNYAEKKLKAVYQYAEKVTKDREDKMEGDLLDELALV